MLVIIDCSPALQMSVPRGSFRTMGVTPQILSRAVTDPLTHYITQQLADRKAGDTWQTYLIRRIVESLRKGDPVAAWTVSTDSRISERDVAYVVRRMNMVVSRPPF